MSSQVWNPFLEASGGTTLATNIGANNLDTRMMLRHLTIFVFYLAPGKFFLSNIGANGLETRISLRHLTIFVVDLAPGKFFRSCGAGAPLRRKKSVGFGIVKKS